MQGLCGYRRSIWLSTGPWYFRNIWRFVLKTCKFVGIFPIISVLGIPSFNMLILHSFSACVSYECRIWLYEAFIYSAGNLCDIFISSCTLEIVERRNSTQLWLDKSHTDLLDDEKRWLHQAVALFLQIPETCRLKYRVLKQEVQGNLMCLMSCASIKFVSFVSSPQWRWSRLFSFCAIFSRNFEPRLLEQSKTISLPRFFWVLRKLWCWIWFNFIW